MPAKMISVSVEMVFSQPLASRREITASIFNYLRIEQSSNHCISEVVVFKLNYDLNDMYTHVLVIFNEIF